MLMLLRDIQGLDGTGGRPGIGGGGAGLPGALGLLWWKIRLKKWCIYIPEMPHVQTKNNN